MSVELENVETMEQIEVINLTEAAAEKLDGIMKEKGVRETHALRVFVSGGGCSGLQYGMTFDPNPREIDTVVMLHGMRVVIDPQSLQYMGGATIDYVDSLMGGGFHIENPNAVSSCGCGHSFKTKDQAGGGCGSCH